MVDLEPSLEPGTARSVLSTLLKRGSNHGGRAGKK